MFFSSLIKIIVFIFPFYFPLQILHYDCWNFSHITLFHTKTWASHIYLSISFCLCFSSSLQYFLLFFTYPPLPPTELLLKAVFITIPFGFSWRVKEKCVQKSISFSFFLSPGKNYHKLSLCFHIEIKVNNFNIPAAQRGDCSKLLNDPFHFLPVILLLSPVSAPFLKVDLMQQIIKYHERNLKKSFLTPSISLLWPISGQKFSVSK